MTAWVTANFPLISQAKGDKPLGEVLLGAITEALKDLLTSNGVTEEKDRKDAMNLFEKTVTHAILNEFGEPFMDFMFK
jgi:hypothetical protein